MPAAIQLTGRGVFDEPAGGGTNDARGDGTTVTSTRSGGCWPFALYVHHRAAHARPASRQETLRLLRPVTVAADLVQSANDLSEAHLIDRIAVNTEIAARQHPQIAGRQVGNDRITDERVRPVYRLARGNTVPELFLGHLKLQRPDRSRP